MVWLVKFILQSLNLIKKIVLKLKPCTWVCILTILDGFILNKTYDERDDFDFEIVNCPYLDGDVRRRASYDVYISQLVWFATVSRQVTDFNTRNKLLTAKLLNQEYRCHQRCKSFLYFIDVISIYFQNSTLDINLSYNKAYQNLNFIVTEHMDLEKLYANNYISTRFRKIILRYIKIGYNVNVIRQTACMVVDQITVNNFASHFGWASDSMVAQT